MCSVHQHDTPRAPGCGIEPVPAVIMQHQQEVKIQRVEGGLVAAVRRCLSAQSGGLFRAALSGEPPPSSPLLQSLSPKDRDHIVYVSKAWRMGCVHADPVRPLQGSPVGWHPWLSRRPTVYAGPVDHICSAPGDMGWGCGWRNMQMLATHLLRRQQACAALLRMTRMRTRCTAHVNARPGVLTKL